jgi:colicin import membrane protein
MRKAFRLRSQGQPFKMMGAEQLTQPLQQDPVQPLYSNPNDPAMQQQQRAPLQQVDERYQSRAGDVNLTQEEIDERNKLEEKSGKSTNEKYQRVGRETDAELTAKADAEAKAKADADAKADAEAAPEEEAAPDAKKKRGNKFLKGAADIITGGLDRVYGSGKTNILANEKAAEYAAQKSADAKTALAEKRAHELEVIKLGTNKDKNKGKTPEEIAEEERLRKLKETEEAINAEEK